MVAMHMRGEMPSISSPSVQSNMLAPLYSNSSMFPVIHGNPRQGPSVSTQNPSEIYSQTRSQLRRTGRTMGALRQTFKKHDIF